MFRELCRLAETNAEAKTARDLWMRSVSNRNRELSGALAAAVNRSSAENGSNTPDFILGDFLIRCLHAYDDTVQARAKWYGHIDAPAGEWMSGEEIRQLIGFLTAEIPELHHVEMYRMNDALIAFKAALETERAKPKDGGTGPSPVARVEPDPRD